MAQPTETRSVEATVCALLPRLNTARGLEAFTRTLVEALLELGVPLYRMSSALLTLHPEVIEQNVTWTSADGVMITGYPYDIMSRPEYLDSPVAAVRNGLHELHCRVDVSDEALPYSTLRDLRDQGVTDYLGFALLMSDGRRSFVSFGTREPAGFSPENVELLRALLPSLALRLELESARHTSRSLLDVYLGRNASKRILAGDVRRGHGERIEAAVFVCDLRNFTAMIDSHAVEEVIPVLDRYFEYMADAVMTQGGDVLKYIGDAMLALFPIGEEGAASTCRAALQAAEHAIDSLASLSEGLPPDLVLRAGIGLHVGEVLFGNVGARARLDFTVMGRAVNEVSRVEQLCRELEVPLLMTARFVETLEGGTAVHSLGRQKLRGVSEPHELFTLPRLAPQR